MPSEICSGLVPILRNFNWQASAAYERKISISNYNAKYLNKNTTRDRSNSIKRRIVATKIHAICKPTGHAHVCPTPKLPFPGGPWRTPSYTRTRQRSFACLLSTDRSSRLTAAMALVRHLLRHDGASAIISNGRFLLH